MFLTVILVLGLVSLVSFVGVLTLGLKVKKIQALVSLLVPFAAGALLGDAFVHLLPHAFAHDHGSGPALAVIVGFLLFFILEKVLFWRHCHRVGCKEHINQVGPLSLVGDGLHNFIDGVIIGASFLESVELGITTSVAVLAHEIPQEIGDFAILIHAGYSRGRAIWFNFLTSLTALAGGLIILLVGSGAEWLDLLLPLTAGGFVYIAASGLVPQLQKEKRAGQLILQVVMLSLGIGIMFLLLGLE